MCVFLGLSVKKNYTAISFKEGFKKVMLNTKNPGDLLSMVRQALVVVK